MSGAGTMKNKNTLKMFLGSQVEEFDSDERKTPSLNNDKERAIVSTNLLQHASRQAVNKSKQLQMLLKRGATPVNH